MTRVLHIITGLDAGGAEQQVRLLVRHLAADCEVATLTHPGLVAEAIEAAGTPVHHLRMGGNRDLAALPRLARLIRRGRYDVVHTHLYRACVYGRLAARLGGVRAVLATEHSLGDELIEGRPLTRGVRALYQASERLGRLTLAVSPTVGDRLVRWGVPPQRVEVLPNAVAAADLAHDPAVRERVRRELGIPPRAVVLGGVGRLVPTKRFDVLVRTLPLRPDLVVLLAGDGPERERLAHLARRLGVPGRLLLTGESAHVAQLLQAMDVLAAPCREEAFGLAVVEALAAGLPVLYEACPALEDLPAAAAPGARRLRLEPDTLAAAVPDRVPPRLPVPPAVHHYDVAGLAARLDEIYLRVAVGGQRRSTSTPFATATTRKG